MEITNEYILKLANREMDVIKDISSPMSSISRVFNKDKQQEAVAKARCAQQRIELLFEIQKYLNS